MVTIDVGDGGAEDNLLLDQYSGSGRPDGGLLLGQWTTGGDPPGNRAVTSERITSRRVTGGARIMALAGLAVVAAVVGLVMASADGGPESARRTPMPAEVEPSPLQETDEGPNLSTAPDGRTLAANFRAWPDPPEDHDPHVAGRPGSGQPVRPELAGKTLIYVNNRGRPTVIDLSTGDQRELDIAGPRDRDRFFVEFGRVVDPSGADGELPDDSGRAFAFTVRRTFIPGRGTSEVDRGAFPGAENGSDPGMETLSGPTLCLDEGACPTAPLTSGVFGNDRDRISSHRSDGGPASAIAELLGSDWSIGEDRWTVFSFADDPPTEDLRMPTPLTNTVVWLVEQTPPTEN